MAGIEINEKLEPAAIIEYMNRANAMLADFNKYGEHWQRYEYSARRSLLAGKLCDAQSAAAQAEAKASRRPGSIGARKARRKAKQLKRKIRELQSDIKIAFKEYNPEKPQYMTADLLDNTYKPIPIRPEKVVCYAAPIPCYRAIGLYK